MGRWGFEMVGHHHKYWGLVTRDGWSFADRSRTTAEITVDFYRAIREAAGDALNLGCATVGHLGAGLFEIQRSADDNCGFCFGETRKMGLNALAMRMPQHGAFHCIDPDIVPITKDVDWRATRQWLQLVSQSSAACFISSDPVAMGEEQKAAVRHALAQAAKPQPQGEPLDWMDTTLPQRWKLNGKTVDFDWYSWAGVNPFLWA
jgi:alpha-galactosidase